MIDWTSPVSLLEPVRHRDPSCGGAQDPDGIAPNFTSPQTRMRTRTDVKCGTREHGARVAFFYGKRPSQARLPIPSTTRLFFTTGRTEKQLPVLTTSRDRRSRTYAQIRICTHRKQRFLARRTPVRTRYVVRSFQHQLSCRRRARILFYSHSFCSHCDACIRSPTDSRRGAGPPEEQNSQRRVHTPYTLALCAWHPRPADVRHSLSPRGSM